MEAGSIATEPTTMELTDTVTAVSTPDEEGSFSFEAQNPYPQVYRLPEESPDKKKKKCFTCSCINGSLIPLKILLFIFYGGIGVISTWLNHVFISARLSEKDSFLAFGIAAFISFPIPFIFGLISDKTAHPKKVLAISLLLAGILYPLILLVPPSDPYQVSWCSNNGVQNYEFKKPVNESMKNGKINGDLNGFESASFSPSCINNEIFCGSKHSELIAEYGVCSQGCKAKMTINKCVFECDDTLAVSHLNKDKNPGSDLNDEDVITTTPFTNGNPSPNSEEIEPNAQQLIGLEDYYDEEDETDESTSPGPDPFNLLANAPPHLCLRNYPKFKSSQLCFAFDEDMHPIELQVDDISGYVAEDGKCHYPLTKPVSGQEQFSKIMTCSPVASHCHVACELEWGSAGGTGTDYWSCKSDFVHWLTDLAYFVAIHSLGTMLVVTAAGLLNTAIVSMTHEHSGLYGCQYMYGALGYAILPPVTAFLFQLVEPLKLPWSLDYIFGFSVWLIVAALLATPLPYHAEWVPKKGTVRPMLARWCCRNQTTTMLILLIILGCLQGLLDILSFHRIHATGVSALFLGLTATAAVGPALLYLCRVEKVIAYCGYPNVFLIALVVFSLQFTGYAYLPNEQPEWGFLLKAMDTFSIILVWTTASHTTYSSAPRSLAATCQTVIVIMYCCIGRGVGGALGYVGLSFLEKETLFKVISVAAVGIAFLYYAIHYSCLRRYPYYTKPYDYEKSQGSGKYTPLKLINGNRGRNFARMEEDVRDDDI